MMCVAKNNCMIYTKVNRTEKNQRKYAPFVCDAFYQNRIRARSTNGNEWIKRYTWQTDDCMSHYVFMYVEMHRMDFGLIQL